MIEFNLEAKQEQIDFIAARQERMEAILKMFNKKFDEEVLDKVVITDEKDDY
jgi:hypothetical protein